MKRVLGWLGVGLVAVLLGPAIASPELDPPPPPDLEPPPSECRVVDLEMQPAAGLQMVAWIEDTAGTFIETIFITRATGSYGIGNRPGVFGMRSGPNWPYGPRDDVFPVWSHRHGLSWRRVRFQNADGDPGGPIDCEDVACKNDPDRNLSHPLSDSSLETLFARPLQPNTPEWDAGSGASEVNTDKGTMMPAGGSPQLYSLYPPRDNLPPAPEDAADVAMFDAENPFDAVSQATPLGDQPYRYSWLIPQELYTGVAVDYVMYLEVAKEFDPNPTYNETSLKTATATSWNEYGLPYRGQPSVIYRVPFQIGPQESHAFTAGYAGYGDPEFTDGVIRSPDATITADLPGSGALRLAVVTDPLAGETYQLRIDARFEVDQTAPGSVGEIAVMDVTRASAAIEIMAPGDDVMEGRAAGFDVRYQVGEPITYQTFGSAPRLSGAPDPEAPGVRQTIAIAGLLPSTTYSIAVRAFDSCRNYGPLSVTEVTTDDRGGGEVDACFVATAAYGSVMANDIQMLRRFRDTVLRSTVVGELAVEAYYTFGPALAGVIKESDLLRATTRSALAPVVDRVRGVKFAPWTEAVPR
jgi:hypothetical protein